jgi:hypothetical protein
MPQQFHDKNHELGFCSKNEGYFCVINPRSGACLQSIWNRRTAIEMNKLSPRQQAACHIMLFPLGIVLPLGWRLDYADTAEFMLSSWELGHA